MDMIVGEELQLRRRGSSVPLFGIGPVPALFEKEKSSIFCARCMELSACATPQNEGGCVWIVPSCLHMWVRQ